MALETDLEEAILEAALGFDDPELQDEFLKHWFREDLVGLERMRGLLAASVASTSFFLEAREARHEIAKEVGQTACEASTSPPFKEQLDASLPELLPQSQVERYRLIQRLGEGGAGVVYEAEQTSPLRRRVALKVIRLGMDTESVLKRFKTERQTMAMMDHRNIAQVFDAGVTAEGRPYFVMELVRGERITTYCDVACLTIVQRLELFVEVCEAIQHAHTKGVVHRDIKPSNVLIQTFANTAMVKVIDFGIAKATEIRFANQTLYTGHDQLLGTPAYMSPEQVDMKGLDIDTRSDIYSLGALLYELLTGKPTFNNRDLQTSGIVEMRRIILECDPPIPSQAVRSSPDELAAIAAARNLEPERLPAMLRGDLDAIIMMAMNKDRNHRYQTADNLAADIQRFLADEPVHASVPSRWYTIKKFVRRNRVACISGLAGAASLILGLSTSTILYMRERKALMIQEQLTQEAKAYQEEKTILKRQAEDRAIITRAAAMIGEGEDEKACTYLLSEPLEHVEPSREACEVFRALGHWCIHHDRETDALHFLRRLDHASRYLDPDTIIEGIDIVAYAPLILEVEGSAQYDRFRNQTLRNYLPVRSTRAAQQLLKICLLTPAKPVILESLKEAVQVSGYHDPGPNRLLPNPDWEAFSMALYFHRTGDYPSVLEWQEKCLSSDVLSRVCATAVRCLGAHASFQTGDRAQAMEDLAFVREELESPRGHLEYTWTWWDWIVTRVLYDEVSAAVGIDG